MDTNAFFTAGQERNGLDLLSGRLDTDLNAAFKRCRLVLQNERGLAAAEHFFKRFAEIFINTGKLPHKDFGHFHRDGGDYRFQLRFGVLHIVALGGQVFVAFGHAGIFVDRTKIRCAEGRDFPAHLGNTLVCGRKAFDFNRLFLGRTGGQFVGIPKFIDDLLFPRVHW